MKIVCAEHSGDVWAAARLGIPSASHADEILTPAKRQLSAKRAGYVAQLVAEWALGKPLVAGGGAGGFLGRGLEQESEALDWLAFDIGAYIERVGFCTLDDGSFGASLDGLIPGMSRSVETKVPSPKQHVANLLAPDDFVAEHFGQVQAGLMVHDIEACYLVSYHGTLPKLVRLITRDEGYIAALRAASAVVWSEVLAGRDAVKRLGFLPTLASAGDVADSEF